MLTGIFLTGLYLVLFALACTHAYKAKKITDLLPSISWSGSIIIPFILVVIPFAENEHAMHLQAIGMCLIGYFLLAGDYLSLRYSLSQDAQRKNELHIKKNLRRKDGQSKLLFYCNIICVGIALTGITVHLSRIGWENIPLLSSLLHADLDETILNHMRDMFSREANLTIFEKYYYNFNVLVFGLPALAYLMITKRFYSMIALFAVCTIYLIASTAKMPFMIFFCVFTLVALHIIFPKHKNAILSIGILTIVTTVVLGGLLRAPFPHSYVEFAAKAQSEGCEIYEDQAPQFCALDATLGDYYRLPIYRELTRPYFVRLYDYSTYRMLVTPVDMNYRWYEYFGNEGDFMGFASIIPPWRQPGYIHPARQVASYALESRFPQEYATAYAYAGIDADAYARMGLTGVFIISVLLFFIRICPAIMHAGHAFSEIYRLMVIGLLIILPPSSSLHAILVAHGLIVITGIICFFKFYDIVLRKFIKNRTDKLKRKLEGLPIH
jgi:hypothetical protein